MPKRDNSELGMFLGAVFLVASMFLAAMGMGWLDGGQP
jgi:hypothetical protein